MLSLEARVALTLRLLAGLTTQEIARAYLVPEATVQQRIVRAKRTLTAARVPIEVPEHGELPERLGSVLEVIYLIFNEGYAATAGDEWMRPELLEEALRLGRILAALLPEEPEVHGLSALMELQASRVRARVGPDGEPILLLDQDRSRWDWMLIGRGLAALERAYATGGAVGTYTLQAAIAACHARARKPEDTDWVEHRRHLRRPRPGRAVAGGRAQPRGRGRHGVRARPGAAARRRPRATSRSSAATTSCRPSAATCWRSWAGSPTREPSSSAPSRSRENARERSVLLERIAGCSTLG